MDRETVTGPIDMLPEYCDYRDEGCSLAKTCLDCPFPECAYDLPRGRQRALLKLRDRTIARQRNAGWKPATLAQKFGVSERTVDRILRNVRHKRSKTWEAMK